MHDVHIPTADELRTTFEPLLTRLGQLVRPEHRAQFADLLDEGKLPWKAIKEVFAVLFEEDLHQAKLFFAPGASLEEGALQMYELRLEHNIKRAEFLVEWETTMKRMGGYRRIEYAISKHRLSLGGFLTD
jgi:hypothetical protein